MSRGEGREKGTPGAKPSQNKTALDLGCFRAYSSPRERWGPAGPQTASQAEVVVPRIKSAKKRMRQTRAHTVHNRTQRSQLRTAIKRVRGAATAADAAKEYAEAVKIIDRAGRKNLIHHNAADRQKSRLARVVEGKKA